MLEIIPIDILVVNDLEEGIVVQTIQISNEDFDFFLDHGLKMVRFVWLVVATTKETGGDDTDGR